MERQKATEELENWKEQQKQKAEDVSCSNEWISFFFISQHLLSVYKVRTFSFQR